MKQYRAWVMVLIIAATTVTIRGQIAITEVMSQPSRSCSPFRGADFFELTNFGTNAVNLHGYGIHDDHDDEVFRPMFAGLTIEPTQSVVFVRTNNAGWDADRFKKWWGEANLPTNVIIRGFYNPGLNGDEGGDELWLRDPDNNIVDVVFFPTATDGRTFENDPATGNFGTLSIVGNNCAVAAALCPDDVGSPGCSTGPTPLRILEQPASQTLQGCGTVRLRVTAQGLPRPKYQWFKDDVLLEGATEATLVLLEVGQTDQFHVVITNGLEEIVSQTATVTIATNPMAPIITAAPRDMTLFREQSAVFCVEARGFPCPGYQWQMDGEDLPGETGSCLSFLVPFDAAYATRQCSVRVWNSEGFTNVTAILTVTPRPELRVTEIMAWPTNDLFSDHSDWFELTNFSTNDVDLAGYRFADSESFRAAMTITNRMVIKPGESIIFVDNMSSSAFRAWWGTDHLKPDLQIVTWYGFSLDNGKDEIYFWNPAALVPTIFEALVSASFASATEGVSFCCFRNSVYDECCGWAGNSPLLSVLGAGGAFRAESGDIGSPGYITNPPPRLLSLRRNGAETTIRARVIPDKTYQLWTTQTLGPPSWMPFSSQAATDYFLEFTHTANEPMRFYRLEELP